MTTRKLLIYNLFPRIAGNFSHWLEHIKRARALNFNFVFINPFHYPGFSGSLYAVKDYYKVNPMFIVPNNERDGMRQLRDFAEEAKKENMALIMDLVINHSARDSHIAEEHPEWFKKDENGDFVSPGAWDDQAGERVVWGDLIEVDNENSSDRENLWKYWLDLVLFYAEMGIVGFRCDAAYMVPDELWNYLISNAKKRFPNIVFLAETLGCTPSESLATAKTGFDYIFNSSKYWDFYSPWCLEQYNLYKGKTRTVSFAESHDTPRLAAETNNNLNQIKLKYCFSVIFSSGVLMPVGYEFGFQKKLDVVHSSPDDWENINFDLSEFIKNCNQLKLDYQVFSEDNDLEIIDNPNPNILTFIKTSKDHSEKALIIINKDDHNYQYVEFDNLFDVFGARKRIKDVSPEYALDFIPEHFEYHLRPAQMIIFHQFQ